MTLGIHWPAARLIVAGLAVLAGGLAAGLWWAAPPVVVRQPPGFSDPTTIVLADVHLDHPTLGGAIEYLRNLSGVNILIDWQSMHGWEITADTKLDLELRLHNVTLAQALECVFASWRGPQGFTERREAIDLVIENGIPIVRFNADRQEPSPQRRVYNVQDLLEHSERWRAVLYRVDDKPPAWSDDSPIHRLIYLLTRSVTPYRWDNLDRPPGDMKFFAGQLIVDQSADTHRQIAQFLEQIRMISNGKLPADSDGGE